MQQVVTITRQGQLTIPQTVRKYFKMSGSTKAILRLHENVIIVEPKNDFWSLPGSLHSPVRLSDAALKKARKTFSSKWARRR